MYSPAHMGIKRNKEADKAEKQALNMSGISTTRLPYTDYCLFISRTRNSEWQRGWETSISKLYYFKPCMKEWERTNNSCRQYYVKLSRTCIGYTRLTHGYLMSRNNQQPTCGNV